MTELAVTEAPDRNAVIAKAVERLIAGATFTEICEETEIPRATLHGWLLHDVGPEYRAIQEQGLIARVLQADAELEQAKDHIAISRARERCKFYRWDLERRAKRLFAPSNEITGPQGAPLIPDEREIVRRFAYIEAIAARAIEGEFVSCINDAPRQERVVVGNPYPEYHKGQPT